MSATSVAPSSTATAPVPSTPLPAGTWAVDPVHSSVELATSTNDHVAQRLVHRGERLGVERCP
jgi:hypothetical protein